MDNWGGLKRKRICVERGDATRASGMATLISIRITKCQLNGKLSKIITVRIYSTMPKRLSGSTRNSGRPTTLSFGSVPHTRESMLTSALSPATK